MSRSNKIILTAAVLQLLILSVLVPFLHNHPASLEKQPDCPVNILEATLVAVVLIAALQLITPYRGLNSLTDPPFRVQKPVQLLTTTRAPPAA